jgi:tRNA(fMet)-specific endonuclease VapC
LIGTLRGQGVARDLLRAVAQQRCVVSVLTRAELLLGMRGRLPAGTLLLLRQYRAVDVDSDIADLAARFGRQYRGTHSGKLPDLLIAATAVVHRLDLVTLNRRDFPMPEVNLYPVPT